MKLFGGNRAEQKAPEKTRVSRRLEAVEQAREEQYLKKLSNAVEKGIPTHKLNSDMESKPQAARQPPASPSPNGNPLPPRPAKTDEPEAITPAAFSAEDPFVKLGDDETAIGDFSYGDIVLLGDDSIAIYNRHIPEKEYDVVYMLQPDGSLEPKGVPLTAHAGRTIGRLPASACRRSCTNMAWERDLIIFHLYEFADVARIAQPTVKRNANGKAVQTHHASETPHVEHRSPLVRGRRFSVIMGDRAWDAVYWGHDEQGALVAHRTTGNWTLMHLDLRRFQGSIKFQDMLEGDALAEVEQALLAAADDSL